MSWIQNISASDVVTGCHPAAGNNSMLIQITDPAGWIPKPYWRFHEVYHFEFLDAEDSCGFPDETKIQDAQAAEIVKLLRYAVDSDINVVVHCMAGLCRSGAVAEVGIMMGLDDTGKYRQPNVRVKTKLMRANGWGYGE